MKSRYLLAVFAIAIGFSTGLCAPSSRLRSLLDRLDEIPKAEGTERSFYLVGCLRAVIEDMIFYSAGLPADLSSEAYDSRLIRINSESAATECRAIVEQLESVNRETESPKNPDVWERIEECMLLAQSLSDGDYPMYDLFRAWESTSWNELDGGYSQYFNCGYGLEKGTRTIRLEGVMLSLEADRTSLLAQHLRLRKAQNEQAILASWLRVVEAGDLDEFLLFGIDSASSVFSRLFGRDFPLNWPMGQSGFPM